MATRSIYSSITARSYSSRRCGQVFGAPRALGAGFKTLLTKDRSADCHEPSGGIHAAWSSAHSGDVDRKGVDGILRFGCGSARNQPRVNKRGLRAMIWRPTIRAEKKPRQMRGLIDLEARSYC